MEPQRMWHQRCVFHRRSAGKQMRGGKSHVQDSEFRPQVEAVVSRPALPQGIGTV